MTNIAFLGLGAMGSRMAQTLLNQNEQLQVYNRNPEKCEAFKDQAVSIANSPMSAVQDADLIFSMVRDDQASQSIWLDKENGAIHGLKTGAIVIECSTLSIPWITELGKIMQNKGVEFLDAPVSGSLPQAQSGELIFLVGGHSASLQKATPILNKLSSAIHYMGDSGSGMRMKLAVNAWFGIQVLAMAEIIGATSKAGLAVDDVVETLNALPVTSPALKGTAQQIKNQQFTPMFPIELVSKDFDYACNLAKISNAKAPLTELAQDIYQQAKNQGFAKENISAVARLFPHS